MACLSHARLAASCLRSQRGRKNAPGLFTRAFRRSAASNGVQRSCDLLVVGGGAGGSAIANKFAASAEGKLRVTVIEPSDTHYYQPMFTLVGGGIKTFDETHRPTRSVLSSHCDWLQDKAIEFDPTACTVRTQKGDVVKYQYLVLALGLQLNYDKIKGLSEALERDPSVCSNYSPRYVRKTWPALQQFAHGNAIFTFPSSPVKCAGAPQKICYLAEEYFTKSGKRDKATLIYNTALPVMLSIPRYANALEKIASDRKIEVNKRRNLIEVRSDQKEAIFECLDSPGKTFSSKYSFLHAVPPMSTPAELWNCPALVDAAHFVNVNRDTLQHVTHKNVFAIGDCSNAPTIRTAAAVAAQLGVIGRNLKQVMEGKEPSGKYDGYTSCPLTIRRKQVMLAEFGYDGSILETFPVDQRKPRYVWSLLNIDILPPLYWHRLVKGHWHGPGFMRKILRLGSA